MSCLTISLLGSMTTSLDGQPVTNFGYDKVRALLAYLAVESERPNKNNGPALRARDKLSIGDR